MKYIFQLVIIQLLTMNDKLLDNFINSLIGLLQNPQKLDKLGTNGFLYIKKNHNWDDLSDQLILMFKELSKK